MPFRWLLIPVSLLLFNSPGLANPAFVGPRQQVPAKAPVSHGFWSFSVPVPQVLSRSGQPLFSSFQWLKAQGWQSVVNLRYPGERSEVADDQEIPGFSELGFHYLWLKIRDGAPPTDEQARQFLAFVTNPDNQPVHVHCRGGFGRTGTMVALYRFAVEGWPMEQAIAESRLYNGGVSTSQAKWLRRYARLNGEVPDLRARAKNQTKF